MREVTCPWCGHKSEPADARFIAESPSLCGDPMLGADQMLRFRPCRFNTDSQPIDPGGTTATRPACPACRCEWPESMWEANRTSIIHVADAQTADELLRSARSRLAKLGYTLETANQTELGEAFTEPSLTPRIAVLKCRHEDSCDIVLLAIDPPHTQADVAVTNHCPSQTQARLHIVISPDATLPPSLFSSTGKPLLDRFLQSNDWPVNCHATPPCDDMWAAVVLLSLEQAQGVAHA
jgi:hypothetical protein